MIVYFSGTGNSRYCAQLFASRPGDELLNSAGCIRHQAKPKQAAVLVPGICGRPERVT